MIRQRITKQVIEAYEAGIVVAVSKLQLCRKPVEQLGLGGAVGANEQQWSLLFSS